MDNEIRTQLLHFVLSHPMVCSAIARDFDLIYRTKRLSMLEMRSILFISRKTFSPVTVSPSNNLHSMESSPANFDPNNAISVHRAFALFFEFQLFAWDSIFGATHPLQRQVSAFGSFRLPCIVLNFNFNFESNRIDFSGASYWCRPSWAWPTYSYWPTIATTKIRWTSIWTRRTSIGRTRSPLFPRVLRAAVKWIGSRQLSKPTCWPPIKHCPKSMFSVSRPPQTPNSFDSHSQRIHVLQIDSRLCIRDADHAYRCVRLLRGIECHLWHQSGSVNRSGKSDRKRINRYWTILSLLPRVAVSENLFGFYAQPHLHGPRDWRVRESVHSASDGSGRLLYCQQHLWLVRGDDRFVAMARLPIQFGFLFVSATMTWNFCRWSFHGSIEGDRCHSNWIYQIPLSSMWVPLRKYDIRILSAFLFFRASCTYTVRTNCRTFPRWN